MRLGAAVKRRCVRYMVSGEDIISDAMAWERSLRDYNTIGHRLLKLFRNSIWSVEDENEVAQGEEGECGQALQRNNSLST